ncbi:MAG: ERF family protein [Candidatus Omnitrophota bacterium]|nr:ERF family protein [Candidatus Omnitrophota bacterium]
MKSQKAPVTKSEIMEAPARLAPLPIEAFIGQAIEKGLPVETIEKFLAMRRELRAEAGKEAYDAAMSRLQGEMPTIRKTKVVKDKFGKARYSYAPIDAIIDQTKALISRQGFSYAVTTEQSEVAGEVKAICTVKHELGHSEQSTFRVPIDKEAFMSGPQKVGAALTFAKRYAFCNAFGIITGDEDTDANEPESAPKPPERPKPPVAPKKPLGASTAPQAKPQEPPKMTVAQQKAVNALIVEAGAEPKTVEEWCKKTFGVQLAELTAAQAGKVIDQMGKQITEKKARETAAVMPQAEDTAEAVAEAFGGTVLPDDPNPAKPWEQGRYAR